MTPTRLAIVGAGPYCTYALERLACTVAATGLSSALEVHVFDRTGDFGAGQIHSPRQPGTSLLNRVAVEVSFAADESVEDAGPLLPKARRPSLYEWCRHRFATTGDPRFDIAPGTWPPRAVHGLALRERFDQYVAMLRQHSSVTVDLHRGEVTDVAECDEAFRVFTAGARTEAITVDRLLFVTGHGEHDPMASPERRRWVELAERTRAAYLPSAYPLEERLTERAVSREQVVACAGTMLTGIDVILHLTEGRGGRFVRNASNRLDYVPSGREPRSIVPFSESGLFAFARPLDVKAKGAAKTKHRGVFLTPKSIDRLREAVGTPPPAGAALRRQLEYDRHVFPLVILEMSLLYYVTLLGEDFGRHLAAVTSPAYEAFVSGRPTDALGDDAPGNAATTALCRPLEAAVDAAAQVIDAFLLGQASYAACGGVDRPWSFDAALRRYVTVVFGADTMDCLAAVIEAPDDVAALIGGVESPWRHPARLRDHRFSWERTIRPIPADAWRAPDAYRKALIDFMATDCLWARQGNFVNPAKTAADGVWRGLRPVIVYAVNDAGLRAESHRAFLGTWLRQHNRLAYGPAPEVMEKMLALVEHGLVDATVGPEAAVDVDGEAFVITGGRTGARRRADVLVDARVRQFDAAADVAPLYPNLLRRGLVRKWRNPSAAGGTGFEPGGLDLTDDFHPVRADGTVDRRLTFIGQCLEGRKFFTGGLMKEHANHHAMRYAVTWVRDLCKQIDGVEPVEPRAAR